MNHSTQAPSPERKKILCRKCYRQIAQEDYLHRGANDEQACLFIQHKRMKIRTFAAVVCCPSCESWWKLVAGEGIVEGYANAYYEKHKSP